MIKRGDKNYISALFRTAERNTCPREDGRLSSAILSIVYLVRVWTDLECWDSSVADESLLNRSQKAEVSSPTFAASDSYLYVASTYVSPHSMCAASVGSK